MDELMSMARQALKKIRNVDTDPYRDGFEGIYKHLVDNCGAWERTIYQEPIRAALEVMDAAWVRRDIVAFQAAIQEINRLILIASKIEEA
jgi:hypothetical protein